MKRNHYAREANRGREGRLCRNNAALLVTEHYNVCIWATDRQKYLQSNTKLLKTHALYGRRIIIAYKNNINMEQWEKKLGDY